jgi:penicillin-binding protein 1A
VVGSIIVLQIMSQLPDVEIISSYVPNETTKIFASNGELLAELHKEENRVLVPISKISDYVKAGVIAMEDKNFYYHHGIDLRGTMRATITNLVKGGKVQGGSTITQQLARNVFLNKSKKIVRKIAEIILALQLERKYTKEEILEFYLNQVYWGHNAYGIESAANLFFGKSASQLNLAESAVLVGMLRGPELYSPFVNPKKSRWRKEIILKRMLDEQLITEEEYFEAKEMPLILAQRKKLKYKAPYFTSYVEKQLIAMYGEDAVYNNGLKVYTSLDMDLQKKGEAALEHYLAEASKPHWVEGEEVSSLNCTQGSILAVEAGTGYIRTWVGGRDFLEREYDHIVQAHRQPGSSFKPYTYLTAINMGMSPGTVMDDLPITFNTVEGPYSPQNYTKDFRGPVTLRRALELSLNVIAVKISDLIDPSNIIVTCRQLGIQSNLSPVLSLTLGASELTLLEHISAFSVFANSGVKIDPISILRIEDRNGKILYQHQIVRKKVYDGNKVNVLVNMMRGVLTRGTGRGAYIPGYDIAGKTGTTSDYRDAWFIGFTPNLLCGVWVGNDDNSQMFKVTGGWIPAQIWQMYMQTALAKYPKDFFPYPRGLVRQRICVVGKALASPTCPEDTVVEELMWDNSKYTEVCQAHNILSGISPFNSGRPDWETTFYPNKGSVVFVKPQDKPKPTANVQATVKKDERVKPKIDLNRGL